VGRRVNSDAAGCRSVPALDPMGGGRYDPVWQDWPDTRETPAGPIGEP
jgi:hypothetical protein